MTTQQMHDWFDIIQDKYSSPYFTDTEKDIFLTRAQYQYVNELFPEELSPINVESNMIRLQNVSSLIYETSNAITPDADGKVSNTDINQELNFVSNSSEDYIRILNVSVNTGVDRVEARFRRHNDFYRLEKNSFKAGSDDVPVFRFMSDGIVLAPKDISYGVYLTLLKEPKDIQLGVTESELPSHTHDKLVAIALELAGVSSRDQALMVINQ